MFGRKNGCVFLHHAKMAGRILKFKICDTSSRMYTFYAGKIICFRWIRRKFYIMRGLVVIYYKKTDSDPVRKKYNSTFSAVI